MKKVFVFILFSVILIAAASSLPQFSLNRLFYYSVCDHPIHYRVDTVDPRFNLLTDAFLSDINLAVQIWDSVIDKKLFVYDPKGDLSINLIYDERQSLTNRINSLENKLQLEKQSLNPQIDQYQKLSSDFKQKVDSLNQEIEYWNKQGGAPPEEYQKLITLQQDLRSEANRLNTMAQHLNLSKDTYNLEVSQLNQTILSFNNALEERPEEGLFKGPEYKIEIYFNNNQDELVHTLTHELGHALDIGHNSNPQAIMYPKTSQTTKAATADIMALENVCRKRSVFELIKNYIITVIPSVARNLKIKQGLTDALNI